MNTPTKEKFFLTKVKTGKGGGLDVIFEIQETIAEEVYTEKYHISSAKDVHPDLESCLKDLREIMGRVFRLTSFLTMIETPDFKANKKQEDQARDFAKEILQHIHVSGISLSGKDDNVGCVITGSFTVFNNQKVAINSPRIKFSNIVYGFEEELEQIIERIELEVYAFLFEGKKAQLSLFDGSAADDDEEEETFTKVETDDDGNPFPDDDQPDEY